MFMLMLAVILIMIEDADTNIDDADTDTKIVKTFSLHLTEHSLIISYLFFRKALLPFSRTQ